MPAPEVNAPTGSWAIAVSGGADSIALLHLLRQRPDLQLHVSHLDHETREGASALDADFVRATSQTLGIPCTIARRSDIEVNMTDLPANVSARFRKVRLKFFREVVAQHNLNGVLLAHHQDDQAETILQRLARGSGVAGLTGMSGDSRIDGLRILRPLLEIPSRDLREFHREQNIAWREDESNRSPEYERNQVRVLLAKFPLLRETALQLGQSSRQLVEWLRTNSPELPSEFAVQQVQKLSPPLARESLRRWLTERGVEEVLPDAIERLYQMCIDAASAPRRQFSGGILVRRRAGKISASLG